MVVLSLLTGGCARAKETAQEAGHPLHPHFTLTQETLSGMVGDLPSSIQQAILSHPEEFLSLLEQVLPLWEEDPFLFLLVDKAHGLPADYEPDDLISLEGRGLSLAKSGLMLRESVLPDLIRMVEAARKDGVELVVGSCYRSYDRQATIYQWEVETYGKEAADRESARPGHSQHQLGLAVDFSPIENRFADLPAGKWLAEHAAAFGFSLSYPDGYEHLTGYRYEPWHFRYLTPQGTALQDRFFDGIQQYMLEFLNTHRAALRAAWKASAP